MLGFIKEAYSSLPEINGATLSGAIDVLVIQQVLLSRSAAVLCRTSALIAHVSCGVTADCSGTGGRLAALLAVVPAHRQVQGTAQSSRPSDQDHGQRAARGL